MITASSTFTHSESNVKKWEKQRNICMTSSCHCILLTGKKNVSASVVPNNMSMGLWVQVTLSGSLLCATNCTLVQLSLMVHHSNMSWWILNNPEKQIPESWFPFGEKIQYSPIWLLQTQFTPCLITIIALLTSASFISWSLILMIMKLRMAWRSNERFLPLKSSQWAEGAF